ncbi:hypothetical protein C8J57DRAFT_1531305 [Mycena rebaudengoi]|nr:hypothetical protein C8J57DRAFT_1531305 [Mycena rebaudengoi]
MTWVSDESGLTLGDEIDVFWFMLSFPGRSPPGFEVNPDWSLAEHERALGLFLHEHGPHMEDDPDIIARLMGSQLAAGGVTLPPQAESSTRRVRKASDTDLSPRKDSVVKKRKQTSASNDLKFETMPTTKEAKRCKSGGGKVKEKSTRGSQSNRGD